MSSPADRPTPTDQSQRMRALDPARSVLVQAPAGSGKTDLLTRRFLRLLAEVDAPGEIVAITFTKAAAAEMRHRILGSLEEAAEANQPQEMDGLSMESLAGRALARSRALGWNLTELPSQLRISTIDSFCRELALQQPLVSGLGGTLDIHPQPKELYRRAARRTLQQIDAGVPALRAAIEALLLWRDNNWQELEDLLAEMLSNRDRWMHGFVFEREPDWDGLRERLDRPFAHAARAALSELSRLLDQVPNARQEALELARFACEQSAGALHRELAELVDLPSAPFTDIEALEDARQACAGLANLLLTAEGALRKQVDRRLGFPANRKGEKARLLQLIADLGAVPGLESALAAVPSLPAVRYSEDDWRIVRACFTLLRYAAAELKVIFAESGAADFIEVAQIAQNTLRSEDGLPTDAALALADGIRHLLVDEFQDTSRRQHQLLASLIAAWPQREGRTCFVVGDPMQSIYFFRDADAELFPRIRDYGLEIPGEPPLLFDHAPLSANFRTTPPLVMHLNSLFGRAFAMADGSGIAFTPAQPTRELSIANDQQIKGTVFSPYRNRTALAGAEAPKGPYPLSSKSSADSDPGAVSYFNLHLSFSPQPSHKKTDGFNVITQEKRPSATQTREILVLIRNRLDTARARGKKCRIAVLGRTRNALAPITEALRGDSIPFRAVDLENLRDRPEILDALSLARALLNPYDRVSWLGVLRAPWCGLSLADLHTLASTDEPAVLTRAVPELLVERLGLLSEDGRSAVARVLGAMDSAAKLRAAQPAAALGTWLEAVWLRLGGAECVPAADRANLNLLWSCLDRLPNGEQDLLGPALDAALEDLNAQPTGAPSDGVSPLGREPDPQASSDCGVQLMTIHKSKGLEFEVVIVPELQADGGRTKPKLLSWLERGLAQPDNSGEITEFLVAPLQTKGADRGKTKEWVDRVYRERELQEARRILYVAATRAREELHLFARPSVKTEKDGSIALVEPASGSLLATAWPALEAEVRQRFEQWAADRLAAPAEPVIIESLAASGEDNLRTVPSPVRPTRLRRLPPDYRPVQVESIRGRESPIPASQTGSVPYELYQRHEGGLLSRALGAAVHTLLEQQARLRSTADWPAARTALPQFGPRAAAEVRALGVGPDQAAKVAAQALRLALSASTDPVGAWILSPHAAAESEARWNGVVAGALREVRVDRVFRAGATPGAPGHDCWWVIDYKTAHPDDLDPRAALPEFRRLFAPQLEAYAEVLRALHGDGAPIRAGLYYPRMSLFDWWEL